MLTPVAAVFSKMEGKVQQLVDAGLSIRRDYASEESVLDMQEMLSGHRWQSSLGLRWQVCNLQECSKFGMVLI